MTLIAVDVKSPLKLIYSLSSLESRSFSYIFCRLIDSFFFPFFFFFRPFLFLFSCSYHVATSPCIESIALFYINIFLIHFHLFQQLQTQNDDGISRWSDEISYCTLADRPVAPARPGVKGRILAHSFKVRWESPADCGGSAISQYSLELDSGNGFVLLWSGPETELVLDKLTPGTTYRVRIFCFNGQEQSDYSEPLIVTTEPVCPEAPAPPSLAGKARANSLQLKWGKCSAHIKFNNKNTFFFLLFKV